MEDVTNTPPVRRKGQPKKPDREPLVIKVLRCADLWILAGALCMFLTMFWLWALHNIRLVTAASQALSGMTAEAVDVSSAKLVAAELKKIREEAPKGATREYKADEQVVLLGRYKDLETTPEWRSLQQYLAEVSSRYPYADEFSLACMDEEKKQLIWLVSPKHATGYSAWLTDLAFPGVDGYDFAAFAGHKEGTVVLVPIEDSGSTQLYICGAFSFAGIMGSEVKKMLIPWGMVLLVLVFASCRLLWIVHRKLAQLEWERAEQYEGEAEEDTEEDAEEAMEEADGSGDKEESADPEE